MSEYFEWINFDKREFLSNYPWNHSFELLTSCVDDREETGAVSALLEGRWAGDTVVFVGDYYRCGIDNAKMREIEAEFSGFAEELQIRAEVAFKDITGLFKQARGECSRVWSDEAEDVVETPYVGPFTLEPIWRRYVVNETKRVYYDRRRTPVVGVSNELVVHRFDPLPIYLCTGTRDERCGTWIGDTLRLQEEPPSGEFTDVSALIGWPGRPIISADDESVLAIVNTDEYRNRVLSSGLDERFDLNLLQELLGITLRAEKASAERIPDNRKPYRFELDKTIKFGDVVAVMLRSGEVYEGRYSDYDKPDDDSAGAIGLRMGYRDYVSIALPDIVSVDKVV